MPSVIYQDDKITKVQKDDGTVITIANAQAPELLKELGAVSPEQAPTTPQVGMQTEQMPWDVEQIATPQPQAPKVATATAPKTNQDWEGSTGVMKKPTEKDWEGSSGVMPKGTGNQPEPGAAAPAKPATPAAPVAAVPSVATAAQPEKPKETEFDKIQNWYNTKQAERKQLLENEKLKLEKETQIDPNRVLGSTGNKILAAIALAFGGLGQGLMKSGNNAAADMLNRIIDRDIDAQKTDAAKRTQAYRDLIQTTGDELQAGLMLKTQALDFATKENQRIIDNKFKSEDQKRQAAIANAQIAELKASTVEKLNSAINKGLQQQFANDPSIPKPLRQITAIPNEADRKEAQEAYSTLQNNQTVINNIGSVYDKVAKTGALESSIPFTKKKAEIDAGIDLFKTEFAKSLGGPVTEADMAAAERVAPKRTDTPAQTMLKKKEMEDYINRRLIQSSKVNIGILQRYGIVPANGDTSGLFNNNKANQESKALGGAKPRGSKSGSW